MSMSVENTTFNLNEQWAKSIAEHSICVDEIVTMDKEHHVTYLGMEENIPTAIKIATISRPVREQQFSKEELIKRKFIVCVIDNWMYKKVYAVYTLAQANQFELSKSQGFANKINWYVMEIPEALQKEACFSCNLMDDGLEIISASEWLKRRS